MVESKSWRCRVVALSGLRSEPLSMDVALTWRPFAADIATAHKMPDLLDGGRVFGRQLSHSRYFTLHLMFWIEWGLRINLRGNVTKSGV